MYSHNCYLTALNPLSVCSFVHSFVRLSGKITFGPGGLSVAAKGCSPPQKIEGSPPQFSITSYPIGFAGPARKVTKTPLWLTIYKLVYCITVQYVESSGSYQDLPKYDGREVKMVLVQIRLSQYVLQTLSYALVNVGFFQQQLNYSQFQKTFI